MGLFFVHELGNTSAGEGGKVTDSLQLQFCDIQGRLFELYRQEGYASADFIKAYMTSDIVKGVIPLIIAASGPAKNIC